MIDHSKKNNLIGLRSILGIALETIPNFPAVFTSGFQCVFIHREPPLPLDPAEITVSCMGKIWSNHGVFPIIKDPYRSVMDEFRFRWFFGVSNTSHFDYIYYVDDRDPHVKIYFRGEFGFYGEDRREEVSRHFHRAMWEYHKMKEKDIRGEIVFHVRDHIIRVIEGGKYANHSLQGWHDFPGQGA